MQTCINILLIHFWPAPKKVDLVHLLRYTWRVCVCDVYVFAFLKVKLHLAEDLLQAVRYNGGGFR